MDGWTVMCKVSEKLGVHTHSSLIMQARKLRTLEISNSAIITTELIHLVKGSSKRATRAIAANAHARQTPENM
jgi:hypothetical protein